MTLLAQLSDPHIEVGHGDSASARALAAAVDSVLGLRPRPHAVLVTGDLVNDPGARAYERARELLAELTMPVFVLGGNHDDRDAMREYFALADGPTGSAGEPFRYSTKVGGLRLIACDTTIPGTDSGSMDVERRHWLETELAEDRETPTVVAMHHPPLVTGLTALDEICLPRADRIAVEELLAANPQVSRVVAGHVHRGAFGVLGGCGVVTCPSTFLQAPLEIGMSDVRLLPEPPAFALHALLDGGTLTSHIQPIG